MDKDLWKKATVDLGGQSSHGLLPTPLQDLTIACCCHNSPQQVI